MASVIQASRASREWKLYVASAVYTSRCIRRRMKCSPVQGPLGYAYVCASIVSAYASEPYGAVLHWRIKGIPCLAFMAGTSSNSRCINRWSDVCQHLWRCHHSRSEIALCMVGGHLQDVSVNNTCWLLQRVCTGDECASVCCRWGGCHRQEGCSDAGGGGAGGGGIILLQQAFEAHCPDVKWGCSLCHDDGVQTRETASWAGIMQPVRDPYKMISKTTSFIAWFEQPHRDT